MSDECEYIEILISDGYIAEDGAPLKCECGCKDFESDDSYYDDHVLIEFSVYCIKCGRNVGTWSYGSWML